MKLHLGCGEKYLEGYVNIDYPESAGSVQKSRRVDEVGDILSLSYRAGSIEEIRLHHVFEHFARPTACALVAAWNGWLEPGGALRIEVPDFQKTARAALSPFSSRRSRTVALRHLFGSHEAPWAVHYEGYSLRLLGELLATFGFSIRERSRNAWRGTYNIDVTAAKTGELDGSTLESRAARYLGNFLVSENDEQPMIAAWLGQFRKQYAASSAKAGG